VAKEQLDTLLTKRSYIIATTKVPKETYELGSGYTLRAIRYRFPGEIFNESLFKSNILSMALSEGHNESWDLYNDLVVFHSFISSEPRLGNTMISYPESPTYIFAERASQVLVNDSTLDFLPDNDSGNSAIDFERYPVVIGMNAELQPHTVYVNYANAFWTFNRLKADSKKNKKLYGQIQLWEFARNFASIHRIYTNEYMPTSFNIAILDSLLRWPKKCKQVYDCPKCGGEGLKHYVESWSVHFLNHYGKQFHKHLNDRSKTFHHAAYLDFFEEWDRIGALVDLDQVKKDFDRLEQLMFGAEDLEQMARVRLLTTFLRMCQPND